MTMVSLIIRPFISISRLKRSAVQSPIRWITNGRATSAGTRYFLEQSKLRIHHALKKSKLYINPIIVGLPMAGVGRIENIDSLYVGSVLQNRTNCLHVYSNTPDGPWYSHAVQKIVEAGIDREGLVTIADIGAVRTKDDIIRQLDEAWSLTQQEYIDIAIIKYDGKWKENYEYHHNNCMQFLDELCAGGILHSYGFSLDIEPFTQHTPPLGGYIGNSLVPIHMEHLIATELKHCEAVFYPLSPTHAISTATSMLPEEVDTMDAMDGSGSTPVSPVGFSRAAVHPFCCYRGKGSVEADASDPFQRLDNMEHISEEAVINALTMQQKRREAEGRGETEPGAPSPDDPVVVMMSKILPPEFSNFFGNLFDQYCPRLSNTPLIEDKVLRVVLSYGHEMAVVEPELCAMMDGPISLSKKDILSVDEVANIFGGFMISAEMEQLMRDTSEERELDMDDVDVDGVDVNNEMSAKDDVQFLNDMETKTEEQNRK